MPNRLRLDSAFARLRLLVAVSKELHVTGVSCQVCLCNVVFHLMVMEAETGCLCSGNWFCGLVVINDHKSPSAEHQASEARVSQARTLGSSRESDGDLDGRVFGEISQKRTHPVWWSPIGRV